MPRDYKHRAAPKSQPKKGAPGWLWLLAGLLIGGFVMGLLALKQDGDGVSDWIGAQPERDPKRNSAEEKAEPVTIPEHKPRFEFYDKLRTNEVTVPEEQLDLRKDIDTADPTASYRIQIASFIKSSDAERMKAELALLGIETQVEMASLSDGSSRYRIVAGPYLGKTALDAARKMLKQNGHKQLLVRVAR